MTKSAKWISGIAATPFVLFMLLSFLLYMPTIQQWAVNCASSYASQQTGMDIRVGEVRLSFPIDLELKQVTACQQNDTLLNVKCLTTDIALMPLFKGTVCIKGFELSQASIYSSNLIEAVRIKAKLEHLYLDARNISLTRKMVVVDGIEANGLEGEVTLNDSVPEDTTPSNPVEWTIMLRQVQISKSKLAVHLQHDSVCIVTGISRLSAEALNLNLPQKEYGAQHLNLHLDSLLYDLTQLPQQNGLDFNHLHLYDGKAKVDSLLFKQEGQQLSLQIPQFSIREKSGLSITSLLCQMKMDSTRLSLPLIDINTPDSHLKASANMQWTALKKGENGKMNAHINAEIGKQDILHFMGGIPAKVQKLYPNQPLTLNGSMNGNVEHVNIPHLQMQLKSAFYLQAEGEAHHIDKPQVRRGQLKLQGRTDDLKFIAALTGLDQSKLTIPRGITFEGNATLNGALCQAKANITEGKGQVNFNGNYQINSENYQAVVDIKDLNCKHFLPQDSLMHLTAHASTKGKGMNPLRPGATNFTEAKIQRLHYGQYDLSGIQIENQLAKGYLNTQLECSNPLLNCSALLGGKLSQKLVDATFSFDLRSIDFHKLHLTQQPLNATLCMHMDGSSDLKNAFTANGSIEDIHISTKDSTFHPKNIYFDLLSKADSTGAAIDAGNLHLRMAADNGYERILAQFNLFLKQFQKQIKQKEVNPDILKKYLPQVTFDCQMGDQNPASYLLAQQGYRINHLDAHFTTDNETGVNGTMKVERLMADSIQLDTIRVAIRQDSARIRFNAGIINGPKNPQFIFNATCQGYITPRDAEASILFLGDKGEVGFRFGAQAELMEDGIRVKFTPEQPVLAYRHFTLNKDNYLQWERSTKRLQGNIDLLADDGTGVKFYSTPNEEALQDFSLSLLNLNLDELTSVIPYCPHIGGLLTGDAHMIQTQTNLSVAGEMQVNKMTYEEAPLGNIGANFVYLPKEDGTQVLEADISKDGQEVANAQGSYIPKGNGDLNLTASLTNFPLSMLNGFIPDQIISFDGGLTGDLNVKGEPSHPILNGTLQSKALSILSAPYSLNLKMEDQPIEIQNSMLQLEDVRFFSKGANPLTLKGSVNLQDLSRIYTNLVIRTNDFELINARKTKNAVAYGKVYVDFIGQIKGYVDELSMRGALNVSGKTDVTYVLKDTPLYVEDRLKDLVTFVNFADTTAQATEKKFEKTTGIDMALGINIDEGAHVHCDISDDGQSYVDFEGGGNLIFKYRPNGTMNMTGRYTMHNGKMKYQLPVIPLKTFDISDGSYVEFNGKVDNPIMNIRAVESVKASVDEGGKAQMVNFDVGINITNTLSKMGLEFTLDAPDNLLIQNQLAAMTAEERGKLAVTMLATGLYLSDTNTAQGVNMNSALNAFLQSEISSIAGNALRTIDLTVGVEDGTTSTGATTTDYSFQFAKRFWNNKVSVIIGGKVSTGAEAQADNQTFIDNVTLEYRLDQGGTRYIRLFYDKDNDDILEGNVSEMGVGLVMRKKVNNLAELFIFKRKKKETNEQK